MLDRYGDPAHGDAPVVLLYFLTTHYRSPLEFSVGRLEEAKASYERIVDALRDLDFRIARAREVEGADAAIDVSQRAQAARATFAEHMDDDLNTAAALGEVFALIADTNRYLAAVDSAKRALDVVALASVREAITDLLALLHIRVPSQEETTADSALDVETCSTGGVALPTASKLVQAGRWEDLELLYHERLSCKDASYAVALRDHYRSEKDWDASDRVRDELQAAGFDVRDTKQGTQVVRRG